MGNVIISTSNVAEGTCPAWMIDMWPNLVALLTANLAGTQNTYVVGNSQPDPADEDKIWLREDSNGRFDRVYNFVGGSWVSPHPDFTGKIIMWEGDISTVGDIDGGVASEAITITSGPMWERVTQLDARFPLGVGTLPSTTAVLVTNTGGEEKHTLIEAELPIHNHRVATQVQGSGGVTGANYVADHSPNTGNAYDLVGTSTLANVGNSTSYGGATPEHNNLPPYYGIYFLRKTARRFYRIP